MSNRKGRVPKAVNLKLTTEERALLEQCLNDDVFRGRGRVILLAAEGRLTADGIALELGISPITVHYHLSQWRKYGVRLAERAVVPGRIRGAYEMIGQACPTCKRVHTLTSVAALFGVEYQRVQELAKRERDWAAKTASVTEPIVDPGY